MCFRHLTEETKQISIYCIWLEAQNYTHLETLSITLWILATLGPSFTVSLLTLYSYYQSYIQKWNAYDLKHPNLLQLYSIYLEGFVFFFLSKRINSIWCCFLLPFCLQIHLLWGWMGRGLIFKLLPRNHKLILF